MSMSLTTEALYGALAEEIYRRNPADQPLTLAKINAVPGQATLSSVGDQGHFLDGSQALAVPSWVGQDIVTHVTQTRANLGIITKQLDELGAKQAREEAERD